ncbi:c-type cytochrome biogenesis protein CcmI [Devosia lacusdianchii]|uniref:c-type cytochrome biogenesis protein CcmI n=1 Tax=Devosia lacusdianchii TaxID=2917991 RepID=UPI001F06ED49|nr:c-type cytochrome biogenesis protein CcmI [Devosia sp. JXJ CY 41]
MLFWFIAIAVTAIACAALFYAAGPRVVNAGTPELDDANSHFRLVLSGIEADLAAGKLGEAEATAAKGELAREMLRLKADDARRVSRSGQPGPLARGALLVVAAARGDLAGEAQRIEDDGARRIWSNSFGQAPLFVGLALIAAVALGLYALLGSPDMPSQPLAGRQDVAAQSIDLGDAITRIEAALTANPDDLRGWTVIAPVYMETGRFADAARAYRRVIELSGATPDVQTSLAEALMFEAGDGSSAEAMDLLRQAAAGDPNHALSRLYIAAELTRQGQFQAAVTAWNEALALSKGDEPWLQAARQGLATAQNNGVEPTNPQEAEMIAQMVSGLAARLAEQGGSIEEWTQLLRAYLVLGDTEKAQATVDAAIAAYPLTFDRGDLDAVALGAGLTLNGATP